MPALIDLHKLFTRETIHKSKPHSITTHDWPVMSAECVLTIALSASCPPSNQLRSHVRGRACLPSHIYVHPSKVEEVPMQKVSEELETEGEDIEERVGHEVVEVVQEGRAIHHHCRHEKAR